MCGPRMRGAPGKWEPAPDAWEWLAGKLALSTPEAIRRAWREGATHATLNRWARMVDAQPEWLPPDLDVDRTWAGEPMGEEDWREALGWE